MLTHSDLLKLKRWNTPTIYNGWEAITMQERLDVRCNRRYGFELYPGVRIQKSSAVDFQQNDLR